MIGEVEFALDFRVSGHRGEISLAKVTGKVIEISKLQARRMPALPAAKNISKILLRRVLPLLYSALRFTGW